MVTLECQVRAAVEPPGDLLVQHRLGQAVLGYTEHQHAAGLGLHLENLDFETFTRQLAGHGKACRAAAYHGNAAARLWQQFGVGKVHIAVKVGNEALELTDAYRRALLAHDTIAFALALVGTDAAAYCRQVAAAVDDGHGVAEITQRQFVYPVGNIIAHRAPLFTLGHLAVKAPLGFGYCLAHGKGLGTGCLKLVFHFYIFFVRTSRQPWLSTLQTFYMILSTLQIYSIFK